MLDSISTTKPLRINKYIIFIAVTWTLLVMLMAYWGLGLMQMEVAGNGLAAAVPQTVLWWAGLVAFWILGLFGMGIGTGHVVKRLREISRTCEELARKEQESSDRKLLLEAVFNSLTDAVIMIDQEQKIIYANQAFTDHFGYRFEEVSGRTTDFLYGDPAAYRDQRRLDDDSASATGRPVCETSYRRKDGTVFLTDTTETPVRGRNNEVLGNVQIIRDIAERKRTEQAAAAASERNQGAEIAANAGSCSWDVTTGVISWSDNLYRLYDLQPEAFDGKIETVMEYVHPDDFDAVQHMLHKLFLDKRPQQITFRIITAAGVEKDIEGYIHVVVDELGKVQKIIAMMQDVSARKRIEKEKELNEERLNILQKMYEMDEIPAREIIEFGLEGCVSLSGSTIGYYCLRSNDKDARDLFIWSGDAIKNCTAEPAMKSSPELAGIWADCIRTGKPIVHNDYMDEPSKKGIPPGHNPLHRHMSVPVSDEEKIVAVVGVANKKKPYGEADIRQVSLLAQGINRVVQKKMKMEAKEDFELQLQRAYKLEAITILADGIAHDFNNVLGIIFVNADVALGDISADNPARANLERIVKASTRAKDLVGQLMVYSHQAEQKVILLDPRTAVEESLRLFRSTAPSATEIVEDLGDDNECLMIEADPAQLQQLFLNLFANALEAENGFEVKGEVATLETEEAAALEDIGNGPCYKLTVCSTGDKAGQTVDGSPLTDAKSAYDTNIGLSIAQGIVRQNNGVMAVKSGPGNVSAFYVYFPLVDSADLLSLEETDERLSGPERILFIDDEVLLAEMTAELLKRKGYQVNVQEDSKAALEVFKANPHGFDVVVTDQGMAKMTGIELAVEMMKIRPDLPVILVSGYSKRISMDKVFETGIKDFLYKPFDTRNLLRIIRKVLDAV